MGFGGYWDYTPFDVNPIEGDYIRSAIFSDAMDRTRVTPFGRGPLWCQPNLPGFIMERSLRPTAKFRGCPKCGFSQDHKKNNTDTHVVWDLAKS